MGGGQGQANPTVSRRSFGTLADGRAVEAFTLATGTGMEAEVLTYGGILRTLRVPNGRGGVADVTLGFDDLASYERPHPYFGTIIGRYGNRIAGARFTLDGVEYRLAANNGPHNLHGGPVGFDRAVWRAVPASDANAARLTLTYVSPDGDQGFPGTMTAEVTYALTRDHELRIVYAATTDKPTVVNLTHHAYFNLGGVDGASESALASVADHTLQINADAFLAVHAGSIPLPGAPAPVAGTAFDLRTPTRLGERLRAPDPQLAGPKGYDHNFVLNIWNEARRGDIRRAATLAHPGSGRTMEVWTTEPGLQIYAGGGLNARGKGGVRYGQNSGIALETQHYPDSPNRPDYPSVRLDPGARYETTTVYRFGGTGL